MRDILKIADKQLSSRLFLGTGKFSDKRIIKKVIAAAQSEVITVALRRVDIDSKDENILDCIPSECIFMPNTSGARNAQEAVRIARLAKAAGCGNWIKIEVIYDNKFLLPDNLETLKAVEILAAEDFVVLPYMSPDLSMGRRMAEAGASAIMPLGSPIGSNRGFKTREIVEIMVRQIGIPIIVDAGLGVPSDAAECMEIGCAAVLVNTAIATAQDPINMANAFSLAVQAGRQAYISGSSPSYNFAQASSPLTGFLTEE